MSLTTVLRIRPAPTQARPEAFQTTGPNGVTDALLTVLRTEEALLGSSEARMVLQAICQSLPAIGFRVTETSYSSSYRQGRGAWFARITAEGHWAQDDRPLSAIRRLFSPSRRPSAGAKVSIEAHSDGRLRVHILGTADARVLDAFVEALRRQGLDVQVEEGGLP